MVTYKSLKTKKKSSLVNYAKRWLRLLAGAVAYESFSLQSLIKSQFKEGFIKVVVTRAGCL